MCMYTHTCKCVYIYIYIYKYFTPDMIHQYVTMQQIFFLSLCPSSCSLFTILLHPNRLYLVIRGLLLEWNRDFGISCILF